jgi:SAM-dependent methyltransferase
MINLARRYNQYGDRCAYFLNQSDSLSAFEDNSWDFIYSNIVLQHMRPEYSKRYIRDFIRILRPGGIVLFQIPAEPVGFASPKEGERLPDSAFRARITPQALSVVAKPTSRIHIPVKVKNLGSTPWLAANKLPGCPIGLGNHWRDDKGELIALDDARARLNQDLQPNEEVELVLVATAPAMPGDYVIELDMVQELVAWFGNKGSAIARVEARVEGDSPVVSAASEAHPMPRIEMYGVPRKQVIDIVTEAGGSMIDVRENLMAGLEWTSFSYCVTKP